MVTLHGLEKLIDVNPFVWLRSVRLPNVILLLLVVAIGLFAARLTWLWVAPPDFDAGVSLSPSSTIKPVATQSPGAQVAQLTQWGLFGQAASHERSIDTVQSSSLGVRLQGIMSGSTPPLVMLDIGNSVKLLQVGDAVSPGVTVHEIEADQVVLSNQGRLEAIRFPPPTSLNTGPVPSVNAVSSPEAASGRSMTTSPGPRPTAQSLMKNPQSLMQYVRLAPVDRAGKLVGLVLHPMPGQTTLLTQLGLVDGDILTEADGQPVANGDVLPHLLALLRAGQPIPVTIERNGRPMQMTINLDALR